MDEVWPSVHNTVASARSRWVTCCTPMSQNCKTALMTGSRFCVKTHFTTRLCSNLRPITRECVHLVRRDHFRSRDKDGFIADRRVHCGNMDFRPLLLSPWPWSDDLHMRTESPTPWGTGGTCPPTFTNGWARGHREQNIKQEIATYFPSWSAKTSICCRK